ncbi:hypothetical protein CI1B_30370 [Bradyrhizobium ivorense]|uniref:Uncharacterized protein n=1 Tax=Bradyrhizobium ivorense TaxID=2511166 RepID=A0A508T932_9BRAD|nr:hypothetical protein CI41S_21640 [Bradyrhizobium ivorense]VIO70384.1 hypothetical protein CI1B_30370 [Bradyrhizobium ivorense]
MVPFPQYKVAYDVADVLPKDFTIREDTIDSSSEMVQTVDDFPVFMREIADDCSRIRIASSELGENQVFLRMMVHLGVYFEVADNRANDLIVRTGPLLKNLQFTLEGDQK